MPRISATLALVSLLSLFSYLDTCRAAEANLTQFSASNLPYLACLALGEAASEGEIGLELVISVMQNRRWQWNEAAFSAARRPGLAAWCQKQPQSAQQSSARLVAAHLRGAAPTTSATHYVTVSFYASARCPRWARRMRLVRRYREHVFLK